LVSPELGSKEGGAGVDRQRLGDQMTDRLVLRRPDDWHVHLRDGEMLKAVVAYTARTFARAIVMPNLDPPITSIATATSYRERILAAAPAGSEFTPMMTL
jgi:dihydroorotase